MQAPAVVLPLSRPPSKVPDATHVRGTVLVSSQRSLRERGFGDAYEAATDEGSREALRLVVASSWLPISLAVAHYQACDALGLEPRTMHEIGRQSGRFIKSATLAMVARLSAQVGATPWAVLGNLSRFTERTWMGSAFEVMKLGPKEAHVRWYGQPCAQLPYFHEAFGAFLCGTVESLCRAAYHRTVPSDAGESASYRISWA